MRSKSNTLSRQHKMLSEWRPYEKSYHDSLNYPRTISCRAEDAGIVEIASRVAVYVIVIEFTSVSRVFHTFTACWRNSAQQSDNTKFPYSPALGDRKRKNNI